MPVRRDWNYKEYKNVKLLLFSVFICEREVFYSTWYSIIVIPITTSLNQRECTVSGLVKMVTMVSLVTKSNGNISTSNLWSVSYIWWDNCKKVDYVIQSHDLTTHHLTTKLSTPTMTGWSVLLGSTSGSLDCILAMVYLSCGVKNISFKLWNWNTVRNKVYTAELAHSLDCQPNARPMIPHSNDMQ